MSGKGDKPRPVDREKWENAPIWETLGPDAKGRPKTQTSRDK